MGIKKALSSPLGSATKYAIFFVRLLARQKYGFSKIICQSVIRVNDRGNSGIDQEHVQSHQIALEILYMSYIYTLRTEI